MASTTTTAPERITDDEAAILRAWLGGHRVQDVAKGRHEDPGHVGRVIDRLCNYDRTLGRKVLDSGLRPAGTSAVARRDPTPAAPLPTEPVPTEAAPAFEPEPAPPTGVASLPAPPSYPVRQPRTGNGRARNAPDPAEAVRVFPRTSRGPTSVAGLGTTACGQERHRRGDIRSSGVWTPASLR